MWTDERLDDRFAASTRFDARHAEYAIYELMFQIGGATMLGISRP